MRFFFFRFQSKSNQTDRTFKYITRHRQIQENARFNFMYWAVWNWEIENICVFNEENIGKNVFRDQIYWSFMSNLKWQAADSSFTHSMSSQQSDVHLFNHMQSWWMASLRRNILTALHIVVINYYRMTWRRAAALKVQLHAGVLFFPQSHSQKFCISGLFVTFMLANTHTHTYSHHYVTRCFTGMMESTCVSITDLYTTLH